jgi:hypothetical protein
LATEELAVAPLQRTSHTSVFTRDFLTKKNMTLVSNCYFSLFLPLEVKLKGSHFNSSELIEAESQAVLNTLTEREFQDEFKKLQKR